MSVYVSLLPRMPFSWLFSFESHHEVKLITEAFFVSSIISSLGSHSQGTLCLPQLPLSLLRCDCGTDLPNPIVISLKAGDSTLSLPPRPSTFALTLLFSIWKKKIQRTTAKFCKLSQDHSACFKIIKEIYKLN